MFPVMANDYERLNKDAAKFDKEVEEFSNKIRDTIMYYVTADQYNKMMREKLEKERKANYNPYQDNTPLTDFFRSRNVENNDIEIEMKEIKGNSK
jgi:hypothetical protein